MEEGELLFFEHELLFAFVLNAPAGPLGQSYHLGLTGQLESALLELLSQGGRHLPADHVALL